MKYNAEIVPIEEIVHLLFSKYAIQKPNIWICIYDNILYYRSCFTLNVKTTGKGLTFSLPVSTCGSTVNR